MRTRQLAITIVALILLLAVTTSTYAATARHPAQPGIVGTWNVVMPGSDGNPDPAETLQTFFADGNFVETTSLLGQGGEGPDHGIWMGSGDTYYWAAQLFLFDKATGAHTGRLRVRATVKLDDANHFTARGVADIIDLEGNETRNIMGTPFDFTGTRMELQLPYLSDPTEMGQAPTRTGSLSDYIW